MIKKNDLKIGNQYYVPGYSGAEKVTLISVNGNLAKVETKKGQRFSRKLQYMFMDAGAANRSKRAWENEMRKDKKR